MKILDVIPVNFDIISEDMKKYLEEPLHQNGYADPTVVVHQRLYKGKPSIESAYDEVLNTRYVYRTIEQNLTEGFGASFINCFGDPGVIAARCKADFLVFGGFEPAVLFALGLADRVGIITVLDNVQPMLWEHVHNAKLALSSFHGADHGCGEMVSQRTKTRPSEIRKDTSARFAQTMARFPNCFILSNSFFKLRPYRRHTAPAVSIVQ